MYGDAAEARDTRDCGVPLPVSSSCVGLKSPRADVPCSGVWYPTDEPIDDAVLVPHARSVHKQAMQGGV